MSEYSTYHDGKWVQVYDLEKCLQSIRVRNEENEERIKRLLEKNKELHNEAYKDNELQNIKSELEKMKADYYRGFPISEEETELIKNWEMRHDEEVHGLTTDDKKLKAAGTIGGRYSYHFYPTSIGTLGVVRCRCGAEFKFKELG